MPRIGEGSVQKQLDSWSMIAFLTSKGKVCYEGRNEILWNVYMCKFNKHCHVCYQVY